MLAILFALVAFAGNSVLCRLALLPSLDSLNANATDTALQPIDATSFTILRLASGSIASLLIIWLKGERLSFTGFRAKKNAFRAWLAPFYLFIYAACFSFAYISLPTAAGALVLFACVQLTMIVSSILAKERLNLQKYCGIALAFIGLCVLMVFSDNAPTDSTVEGLSLSANIIIGFLLMILSGIAWGMYTLVGRVSVKPVVDTSTNFVMSLPFCLLLSIVYLFLPASVSFYGGILAITSGVVTSAMGYAIWYYVLPQLTRVSAGVIQLLVPIIAAIGGLIWAQEPLGLTLILAQMLVLGGIALVMMNVKRQA